MYQMTEDEFEDAVQEAIDNMPDQFLDSMENVAIVVADEPTDEELYRLDENGESAGVREGDEVLGLYEGVSITERTFADYEGEVPDVITIFKGPHERCFHSREEIVAQVQKTVIHEIGHYFGLDDARLHEMGY